MEGVAAQSRVILLELELLSFELFVAGGGVARGGFALFPSFGAFDGDDFSGHGVIPFP